MSAVIKNLSPLKPWQHAKQSFNVFYYRIYGGGATLRSLYTSPWGTAKTFGYIWKTYIDPRDARSPSEGMDVSQSETDARGFAIYGIVRVGGSNVIPAIETNDHGESSR